jgi:HK97 gp10 family phage protein
MADGGVVYISHLDEVLDKLDKTAAQRMTKAVMAVQEEAFKLTSRPGQGREYYVPGFRRKYRASTPGNPPAQASGILHKTIKWQVNKDGADIEGLVGSEQKYAKAVEYGSHHPMSASLKSGEKVTLGGYYVAPRPWLRPAFEKSEEKVKQIFTEEWFK